MELCALVGVPTLVDLWVGGEVLATTASTVTSLLRHPGYQPQRNAQSFKLVVRHEIESRAVVAGIFLIFHEFNAPIREWVRGLIRYRTGRGRSVDILGKPGWQPVLNLLLPHCR